MKKVTLSNGLLGALGLFCASAFCLLGSLRVYYTERQLPGSTVTTQATVVDKELWAVYPVYYEVAYAFSAPYPEDGAGGPRREYRETTKVSRDFYNALRPGDRIIITYPTADPYRSVIGPEFRSGPPWAFPLLGLLFSIVFFVLGRRRLEVYNFRRHLARVRRRES
jgi:hypothetical protein